MANQILAINRDKGGSVFFGVKVRKSINQLL